MKLFMFENIQGFFFLKIEIFSDSSNSQDLYAKVQ